MQVRLIELRDCPRICDMARHAQTKLTASGSPQRLSPVTPEIIAAHCQQGSGYVLEEASSLLGSVFVPWVTPETLPALIPWGLVDPTLSIRFLHALVIAPERQGHGLGAVLLAGVKDHLAAQSPKTIVLDCWAGNEKLRWFYTQAGFALHGLFPEDDYEIAVYTWHSDKREALL